MILLLRCEWKAAQSVEVVGKMQNPLWIWKPSALPSFLFYIFAQQWTEFCARKIHTQWNYDSPRISKSSTCHTLSLHFFLKSPELPKHSFYTRNPWIHDLFSRLLNLKFFAIKIDIFKKDSRDVFTSSWLLKIKSEGQQKKRVWNLSSNPKLWLNGEKKFKMKNLRWKVLKAELIWFGFWVKLFSFLPFWTFHLQLRFILITMTSDFLMI